MRLTLTGLAVALPLFLAGQTITIKQVQLAGEKVIVVYDLEDGNPNNEYLLNLYASKDNFAMPLTKVAGDVGMEIKPGTNKKIEWSIMQEFGGYKGKISLEVRGKVYVPFVRIHELGSKTMKRGKSYPITWKAGSSNPISIDLYKGGQRISGEVNQPNNGSHTLFIPAHATNGDDYRIKFSDPRNPEEVVYTKNFKVAAKIPTIVKFGLPVIAVGVLVAVLLSGDGGGGDPPVDNDPTIEDPDFPN